MMVHRSDSGRLETTWLGKLALALVILALGGGLNIMISKLDSAVTRDDISWLQAEGRALGDSFTKQDGERIEYRLQLLEDRQRLLELWVAEDKITSETIMSDLAEAKKERHEIRRLLEVHFGRER